MYESVILGKLLQCQLDLLLTYDKSDILQVCALIYNTAFNSKILVYMVTHGLILWGLYGSGTLSFFAVVKVAAVPQMVSHCCACQGHQCKWPAVLPACHWQTPLVPKWAVWGRFEWGKRKAGGRWAAGGDGFQQQQCAMILSPFFQPDFPLPLLRLQRGVGPEMASTAGS